MGALAPTRQDLCAPSHLLRAVQERHRAISDVAAKVELVVRKRSRGVSADVSRWEGRFAAHPSGDVCLTLSTMANVLAGLGSRVWKDTGVHVVSRHWTVKGSRVYGVRR